MEQMESEIDLLQVEKRIRTRVKKQMEKSRRKYLNEQMKAIQRNLVKLRMNLMSLKHSNKKSLTQKMPQEAGKLSKNCKSLR